MHCRITPDTGKVRGYIGIGAILIYAPLCVCVCVCVCVRESVSIYAISMSLNITMNFTFLVFPTLWLIRRIIPCKCRKK